MQTQQFRVNRLSWGWGRGQLPYVSIRGCVLGHVIISSAWLGIIRGWNWVLSQGPMASKPCQRQADSAALWLRINPCFELRESLPPLWPCSDPDSLPEKMEVPQEGLPSPFSTIPHILHPISEGEVSLLPSKNSLATKFPTLHTSPAPETSPLPFGNKQPQGPPHHHPMLKVAFPGGPSSGGQLWIQVQALSLTSCTTLSQSFHLCISVPTSAKWE